MKRSDSPSVCRPVVEDDAEADHFLSFRPAQDVAHQSKRDGTCPRRSKSEWLVFVGAENTRHPPLPSTPPIITCPSEPDWPSPPPPPTEERGNRILPSACRIRRKAEETTGSHGIRSFRRAEEQSGRFWCAKEKHSIEVDANVPGLFRMNLSIFPSVVGLVTVPVT